MRSPRLAKLTAVTIALVASSAGPGAAYQRIKFGPLEIVPSLSVEIRQHSNIYLTDDQSPSTPTSDVSGIIIDIRPGIGLAFRPNLEKTIRGLTFNASYTPTLIFFPQAPALCGVPPLEDCPEGRASEPDVFKFDHSAHANVRYQMGKGFTISGGADFTQPQLSQADISLSDLTLRAGAKFDLSRTMSLEGSVRYTDFKTPSQSIIGSDPGVSVVDDTPFGTYKEFRYDAIFDWQAGRTLNVGVHFFQQDRDFLAFSDVPPAPDGSHVNDINGDGIPDNSKDYEQRTVEAFATKQLGRQARATVRAGRRWRESKLRQFAPKNRDRWIGSGTFETVLSETTRLQSSLEFTQTDTIRRVGFEDINVFTTDQIGQFSVIQEQFSTVYSRRFLVDFIQNVFQRGDQLLLGFAYQNNDLIDQLATQNFFVPGTPFSRTLDESVCEIPAEDGKTKGAQFCETVANNAEDRSWLITGGYRLRLKKWLGLQVRLAYFDGETQLRAKNVHAGETLPDGSIAPTQEDPPLQTTTYWNLTGGVVINLQAFQ